MRIDQASLLALLRNDQRDLAARYHAQTDGERIIGLEAHQLCAEAAADDLGQDRDNGQHDREAEHLDGQALQIGLDADGREEQRREQHIAEHVGLACNVVTRRGQTAHYDACEVCAGDVGDAEEALCNVAHQQGERNRINRDAAVLVPFLLHLEECLVHDQADDRNEYEERYNAGQNEQRAYRRIGQRAQNGQDDDAQNIVDNGRAQYRCADPAFQLAHLAQRLDRDRNRGCGQNDADERRLDHVHLIARVVVERKIAAHAADIAKGVKGARDIDDKMAAARHKMDWDEMFEIALDGEKARRFFEQTPPADRHTCSMCGKMCAVRTTNMILEGKEVKFCSEK